MADSKKSFLMYADWVTIFDQLTDEEAGVLVKHLFAYVNDRSPSLCDRMLNIVFEPIKIQLKRDLRKWEGEKEEKSNGGKKGNLKRYHIDLYNKLINKELSLEEALSIAKSRNVSDTVGMREENSDSLASVAVNVNVNDSVNVNVLNNNSVAAKKIEIEIEEKSTVKKMDEVWKTYKPNYPSMIQEDYHALLQIAYLIAKSKGWKQGDVISEKSLEVVKIWENTIIFLVNNGGKWINSLTLSSLAIAKNWQKVINEFQSHTDSKNSELEKIKNTENTQKNSKEGWYNQMFKTKEDYEKAVREWEE